MLNIVFKQRGLAEDRAADHMLRVGKYQCAEVEVDPMPELPLDHVLWGTAAFMGNYAKTSY